MSTEARKSRVSTINSDLEAFKKSNQKIEDEFKPLKKRSKQNQCITFLASRPKWLWVSILGVIGCSFVGALAATIVTLSYNPTSPTIPDYPMNSTAGKPCTASSDCIANAYCKIASGDTVGSCVCTTTYYFDATTSTCLARKARTQSCTYSYECLEYKRLSCISSTCSCDSNTMFWNSTVSECQYLKVPFTLCTSSSECGFPSTCQSPSPLTSYYRCVCNSYNSWWFNTATGVCETRKQVGVQCNYDFECQSGAYCATTSSSSTKVCVCDSTFFNNNGACTTKQGYWTGCSLVDQCNINQYNLRCISGICRCDLTAEYWDSFYLKCMPLKTYGQTCSSNSDCISGFTCAFPSAGGNRRACICSSSQYFDWITGTCQTLKAYNSICNSRAECSNQDGTMICMASNGGVTKRCLCAPNYAYLSSSNCLLKKYYGTTCSSNSECQDHLGLICSTTCTCASTDMWDSTLKKCVPRKRKNDLCYAQAECSSGCCGYGCNWCCGWGYHCCGCGSCYSTIPGVCN